MAARYSVGVVGKALASSTNGATIAIRAGANEVRLQELLQMAPSGMGTSTESWRLYRTTAVGTASTSVLGQAEDPADPASLTNVDTAWSVEPTAAGQWIRARPISLNAGDATFLRWHWQDGLVIPASGSIIARRDAAAAQSWPTIVWTAVWEE